jgi:hypothetical protein
VRKIIFLSRGVTVLLQFTQVEKNTKCWNKNKKMSIATTGKGFGDEMERLKS